MKVPTCACSAVEIQSPSTTNILDVEQHGEGQHMQRQLTHRQPCGLTAADAASTRGLVVGECVAALTGLVWS